MPKKTVVDLMKKYKSNNPFEIARQKGIIIIYEDLGDILGYYNRYTRIPFIHINNKLDEVLQKFVCAHELGHAVLHSDANTSFLKKNTFFSTDKIEVEANTFAVELLMPDEKVYEYEYTNLSVSEIGEIFGVPRELVHFKTLEDHQKFFDL